MTGLPCDNLRVPVARRADGTRCGAPRRSGDDQRGAVPLELALGVGLLVLPVALLVAVFPGWAERTAMARVAAQEAARAAVLAEAPADAANAGRAMALQIAANHDVPEGDVTAEVSVPVDAAGDLHRGADVVATVTVAIRMPALPLTGAGWSVGWTVTHRERVDDHRSLR